MHLTNSASMCCCRAIFGLYLATVLFCMRCPMSWLNLTYSNLFSCLLIQLLHNQRKVPPSALSAQIQFTNLMEPFLDTCVVHCTSPEGVPAVHLHQQVQWKQCKNCWMFKSTAATLHSVLCCPGFRDEMRNVTLQGWKRLRKLSRNGACRLEITYRHLHTLNYASDSSIVGDQIHTDSFPQGRKTCSSVCLFFIFLFSFLLFSPF